jgi:NAD(P)-dependent dehydrogenase (short-subunit alcohol dehydrogenase family)
MLEHKAQGHLVFVSSIMAATGFAGYTAYGASKWAVRGVSLPSDARRPWAPLCVCCVQGYSPRVMQAWPTRCATS